MDHPMIGWESSFDSYDEALDTYDFSGSFDDDSFIEPHVERSLERTKMKHSEVTNRCLSMRVALCALPDVRAATETCLATLPRPAAPPPPEVIRAPIWTTWARYKQNVDQKKTLTFAREILHHDLPASVMEIDDKWQAGYGELDFDMNKFPDPKEMVDELHALGFAVTLWVMPFVEEDTDAYREGSEKGYFVTSKRRHGNLKPGFFKWWNTPPVVALDVTNPDAVNWFVTRLKSLQQRYGIDGFKFDAGEPCFLPRMFETHEALGHPSEYTRYWVERVASQFALAEVRTGHGTTGVGVLTRMGDRFSEWGSGNGLRSIIPTLLTSGVMGYPFCLPDMIGGNAYFGRRPDRELLVRWAQANALMPAMQFSIAPWDAGADVAELIKQSLKVRENRGCHDPTHRRGVFRPRADVPPDVVAGPDGREDVPHRRPVRRRRRRHRRARRDAGRRHQGRVPHEGLVGGYFRGGRRRRGEKNVPRRRVALRVRRAAAQAAVLRARRRRRARRVVMIRG
jgi:hypothetical protein